MTKLHLKTFLHPPLNIPLSEISSDIIFYIKDVKIEFVPKLPISFYDRFSTCKLGKVSFLRFKHCWYLGPDSSKSRVLIAFLSSIFPKAKYLTPIIWISLFDNDKLTNDTSLPSIIYKHPPSLIKLLSMKSVLRLEKVAVDKYYIPLDLIKLSLTSSTSNSIYLP